MLFDPLQVEQVGGPSFIEEVIGPALLAVAAIFAAGLAAWVARKNHSSQLAHDRQLRDTEHARRSISAAVDHITEALDAAASYATAVWSASEAGERSRAATDAVDSLPYMDYDEEGQRIDHRSVAMRDAEPTEWLEGERAMEEAEVAAIRAETEAAEHAMARRAPFSDQITNVAADSWKLQISIGTETDVVKKHQAVARAFSDWCDTLGMDSPAGWKLKEKPSIDPVAAAMADFVKASQEWAAKRVEGTLEKPTQTASD
jgi:hypothetical protein